MNGKQTGGGGHSGGAHEGGESLGTQGGVNPPPAPLQGGRGAQLSMLSAAETPQALVVSGSAGLGSTPPAVNAQASGSGASQGTGMAAGFGGIAGIGSNQRRGMRSVNGDAHRQQVPAASQVVSDSGDPISVLRQEDNINTVKNISTIMDDANVLERILNGDEKPTDLPLALFRSITNDFSEERRIGHGGFGVVYKGVLGKRIVAVKRIYVNLQNIDDDDKQFGREINSLWNTNHQNVVRFLGFCSNIHQKHITYDGKMILANVRERLFCFEYISNGSLDKHITDELRGLEWKTRYKIIIGICEGLRYLHEEINIIHMDLKPANILLDHQDEKHMVPKITDFGLSRPNKISCTVGQRYGTLEYMAPEYREESKTTQSCDIYSLGLIIIELVTGCKDVPNKDNVLRRWRHRWNKPPTQLQYQQVTRCIDIAEHCREKNPKDRPSISKIIDDFLSESKSTYGRISPRFDEDDMLRINPLELRLPSELKNEMSCSVELTNDTCKCIAFNIQLPSAQYIVQPVRGIVQPGSMYVVTITMQARDVRECDHADKFIVQSMQVEASEGLRDDVIAEGMFEKTGKFVDKVDLMVVYEPTKPLEICKRREDTNTPAEEVPKLMRRKIGKSSSGSSGKAEAAYIVSLAAKKRKIGSAGVDPGSALQEAIKNDPGNPKINPDMFIGVMHALWLSYQQLNLDIRRCFEYCSIFPRRSKLRREELVRLWIAQGFVKTSCATEDMEDVAEGYIQELVSRSFLLPEGTSSDTDCFTIHDTLHDLLDKVARNCFRIENARSQGGKDWKGDVPRDVEHLFVQKYDAELITEKILGLEKLCTLIIYVVEEDTPLEEKDVESIFKELPELRVLAFAFSQENDPIKQANRFSIPESIWQLKHLRYFAFRTEVSCTLILPKALNKLQHVQLLDFGDGNIVDFNFGDHINLRHISCKTYMNFANIGRLTSLQKLSGFAIRTEPGYEVKQLRDLNKLRGGLAISGLVNVKSKEEALEANLGAKDRLTELTLLWNEGDTSVCSPEVETKVLEGLCPPVGLQELYIWYFKGSRYPDWMVGKHNSGPKDLQTLAVWGCTQLGGPQLAKAFPHLQSLSLWYCEWDVLPGNMENLTSLKELLISQCLNIRSLPTLPLSLEKFKVLKCNYKFMESCQTVGHRNWQKIEHIPNKTFI